MNKNYFIIIISILVFYMLNLSNKKKYIENMENCSLTENIVLENPIFYDLKNIKGTKFYKHVSDFYNSITDKKLLLSEIIEPSDISKLEKIINSYSLTNPLFNISINNTTTLHNVKNIILKNIILNHLACFGDEDPHIFWIKLHLLNKQYKPLNNILIKNEITESFNLLPENYSQNKKIISFNKHQNNIVPFLFNKHIILKDIPNSIELIFNDKIDLIMLDILNYLVNLNDKNINYKKINKQLNDLFVDLRELHFINQIMKNNPDYQFGFSNNNKTFILNHKLLIENHKNIFDTLMNDLKSFENIFFQHSISKTSNQNIKKVFFTKLQTYLIYNGIKITNSDYLLLDLNTINLKHLFDDNLFNNKINKEFIVAYNNFLNNKENPKLSFRLKKNNLF